MNGAPAVRSIKRKKLLDVYVYERSVAIKVNSRLFEIVTVLVHLNHIARFIVKFAPVIYWVVFAHGPPYAQERGLLFQNKSGAALTFSAKSTTNGMK